MGKNDEKIVMDVATEASKSMFDTDKTTQTEPTPNYNVTQVNGKYVTASSLAKKHGHHVAIFVFLTALVFGTTLFVNKDKLIKYGSDFLASRETAEDVLLQEESGYTFAFGTDPTDTRDFSTYSIPKPDEALEDQFYEALNTSPAFEEIDNVNQIIDYDQFDKDGNISEEAMREIISIAKETE